MTVAPEAAPEAAPPSVPAGGESRPWHRYALVAILLAAAVLYAWNLWSAGWGNGFYTAAVKSMSRGVENFLFGSFDPAGVVTVDKPPMALWPQVLSTQLFGFHGWAVLLPQAIEGVLAVFLLHRTVRRWAGEPAALIAALVLALTPITVMIDRTNNTDPLLLLLLVAGAYALTRSLDGRASPRAVTGWLLLSAFLVGCGFVTKMLAAWMVLPAFVAAYLAGRRAGWGRRFADLAAAAVVLLVSSLWWVALVDLWPGDKPYIGGSTTGGAWDLVIGYNGLGRIFGQSFVNGDASRQGPGMRPPGGSPGDFGGGFGGGGTGPGRLFGDSLGGQIGWLLPFVLLVLVVAVVLGMSRWRRGAPIDPARRGGWTLWGGWLLVLGAVFSFQPDQGNRPGSLARAWCWSILAAPAGRERAFRSTSAGAPSAESARTTT